MSNNDPSNQFAGVEDCPKEQEFTCPDCGERFSYPGHLEPLSAYREHREEEHPETNALQSAHTALVEGGTICSDCGQAFTTDDAYEAHDCPETQVSTSKKAAKKAKAGGKKAKDTTTQEFREFFDDFGPKDLLAIIVGVGVGTMVGHDFEQALTIALAVGGGGVLDAARKKKLSKFDPVHLKFLRQHAYAFLLGFLVGAAYIFAFHGPEINAPDVWYRILDQLWNSSGILTAGSPTR